MKQNSKVVLGFALMSMSLAACASYKSSIGGQATGEAGAQAPATVPVTAQKAVAPMVQGQINTINEQFGEFKDTNLQGSNQQQFEVDLCPGSNSDLDSSGCTPEFLIACQIKDCVATDLARNELIGGASVVGQDATMMHYQFVNPFEVPLGLKISIFYVNSQ